MPRKTKTRFITFVEKLLASGRIAFSRADAEKELGLPRLSVLKSARLLEKQGKLYSPRNGYYVAVPPQFSFWGSPPPSWFIDDLMRFEGLAYYVGLLKAAELHGAAHQAVMEFQVITSGRLPKLRAGRSIVCFYFRREIEEVAGGTERRNTEAGTMRISSPELTALDLVRYVHATGGLDQVLTVLIELGAKIDGGKLAILCPKFEAAVRQRLGYLLSRGGHAHAAEVIHASLSNDPTFRWVELDPSTKAQADPDLCIEPIKRDSRWRLIVRREPEADQQ